MKNDGLTLIECVFTLLLIALLGGLAFSHYADLTDEAQAYAARATVDEAQVRINTRFLDQMQAGRSCRQAQASVDRLSKLADAPAERRFGDFRLSTSDGDGQLTAEGVAITAESLATGRSFSSAGVLKLPNCERLLLSPEGGLEGDGGFESEKDDGMIKPDGSCNPAVFPCGISRVFYRFLETSDQKFWLDLKGFLTGGTVHAMDTRPHAEMFTSRLEADFERYLIGTPYEGFKLSEKVWAVDLYKLSFSPFIHLEFRVVISGMDQTAAMEAAESGETAACELYGTEGDRIRYEEVSLNVKNTWLSGPYPALTTEALP